MKVGVTGSAGFLGANLVRYLHDHAAGDAEIVPFYSSRRRNPLTADLPLDYRHLDVTSRREALERTRGIDLLFHVAGAVDFSAAGFRRTWEVNVLGARNVFEAALENGVRRLVYVSSINVLGTADPRSPPVDETNPVYGSPANPISFADRRQALAAVDASLAGDWSFARRCRVPYFDSKLAGYELAAAWHRERGLPVVVVCPGTAVGAGDVGFSITDLVMRVFAGRLRVTLPGGTSFVSAADVGQGLWLAGLRGRIGETYIVTGREEDNLSYRAFMERVAEVARSRYGRRVGRRFLTLPHPLARALARAAGGLPSVRGLSEGLVRSGCAHHRFSCAKARGELGYAPRVPLDRAIQACIDFHLRTNGETSR